MNKNELFSTRKTSNVRARVPVSKEKKVVFWCLIHTSKYVTKMSWSVATGGFVVKTRSNNLLSVVEQLDTFCCVNEGLLDGPF